MHVEVEDIQEKITRVPTPERYSWRCGYCGKFLAKNIPLDKFADIEAPDWARRWKCPHCGKQDSNW